MMALRARSNRFAAVAEGLALVEATRRATWLVLDGVFAPRFLIAYMAAVNRQTHETHLLYRIQRHHLEPRRRETVAWCDTLRDAQAWCERFLDTPEFGVPMATSYGSAMTPEQQRELWSAGIEPRTGRPR